MKRVREILLASIFGVPGAVIGFLYAHHLVNESITAQIAKRGWVDSTGLDESYVIWGLMGYLVSLLLLSGVRSMCHRKLSKGSNSVA